MIGEALSDEMVRYAARVRQENPLFTKALDGTMSPPLIARYLANVHQLVLHTPVHLQRARKAAEARGDAELAKHFQHKLGEEAGHDAWAAKDREGLAKRTGATAQDGVTASMARLLVHIEGLIDKDPALYLAYILFAEQLTVLMGSEWLELLESRCGVPRTLISVVGNHAELDKDHVADALDEIDELVGDPSKLPAMREALLASISKFDEFCVEVTSTSKDRDAVQSSSEKHIAAA